MFPVFHCFPSCHMAFHILLLLFIWFVKLSQILLFLSHFLFCMCDSVDFAMFLIGWWLSFSAGGSLSLSLSPPTSVFRSFFISHRLVINVLDPRGKKGGSVKQVRRYLLLNQFPHFYKFRRRHCLPALCLSSTILRIL